MQSTIALNLIFMNKSSRYFTIVQWCAVILRTISATLSFCIYPKNSSAVLTGLQSRPGSDFAENCSLFRNKFNYSRAKLCQFLSKAWHGKSPNIWKKFQAGNLKRNRDRWLSNRTEKYCTISILVFYWDPALIIY